MQQREPNAAVTDHDPLDPDQVRLVRAWKSLWPPLLRRTLIATVLGMVVGAAVVLTASTEKKSSSISMVLILLVATFVMTHALYWLGLPFVAMQESDSYWLKSDWYSRRIQQRVVAYMAFFLPLCCVLGLLFENVRWGSAFPWVAIPGFLGALVYAHWVGRPKSSGGANL